jgi:nucleoside-diphosphate-sugar epimerase
MIRRPNRDRDIKGVPNVTQVQGDLSQLDSLRPAVRGCEVVFHAAVSYGSYAEQTQVNVEGTRQLALACADEGVARFVHVSSVAAYGYAVRGRVTEDTPLAPAQEPYSITKARAEQALQDVSAQRGLAYSIVRPGGIYGAGSGLWTRTMFSIARRRPLIFIGDGAGNVPLIYVDDLTRLIALCATHPQATHTAFNAVYDPSYTWRAFLLAYANLVGGRRWLGVPFAPVHVLARLVAFFAPKPSSYATLAEVLAYARSNVAFSCEKAQRLLGWQPTVTLEEGVSLCLPYLQAR